MTDSTDDFYSVLGLNIRQAREQRGLTQEELGRHLSPPVTRASIANIEGGKQRVLVHALVQISDALDVEISDLVRPRGKQNFPEKRRNVTAPEVKELQTRLSKTLGETRMSELLQKLQEDPRASLTSQPPPSK